jgi:vitamin B12 transporter
VVEGGTQVVSPPEEEAPPPRSDPYRAGARTLIPREAFAETQKTVADVLEEVPGLTVTRSGDALGATRVTVRGSRPDQVLILLDGVPLTAAADRPAARRNESRAGADLAGIALEQVESIEVVRGAAASLYGPGAAAGAILIRTRQAPEPALSVSATGGSDGYRELDAAWTLAWPRTSARPGAALTLHANHRRSNGSYVFYDADAAAGLPVDNPCAVPLGGGLFRRGCNATRTTTLEADWRGGAERRLAALLEEVERDGLGGVQDYRPYGHERHRRLRLRYADGTRLGAAAADEGEPAATRLQWQLSAERLRGERNENTTLPPDAALYGVFTDDHVAGELRGERWLLRHRLELGTALRRQVLEDRAFAAARTTASVFGAWDFHPPTGTWEASLRHDALSDRPGRTTARLAASHGLGAGFGLKSSAGSAFRPPTLYELYDPGLFGDVTAVGNPALESETTRSVDGGLYLQRGEALYAELLAFRQRADRQIVVVESRFENLDATRTAGLEAALSLRGLGGVGGLTLDAAWTEQSTAILAHLDPRYVGHAVPGVPDRHGNLSLAWRRGGWHAWLQARHSGRRYVDAANSRYLLPYTVVDVGGTVPLGGGWSAGVEGRNVGNVTYAELDNFPPPGAQLFFTLRWQREPAAAEGGNARARP